MMQEAIDRGCDTYLTGDFRVRHGGPWAEEHRPDFDAFVEAPINLIGASTSPPRPKSSAADARLVQ
jgi:hypothetical protein